MRVAEQADGGEVVGLQMLGASAAVTCSGDRKPETPTPRHTLPQAGDPRAAALCLREPGLSRPHRPLRRLQPPALCSPRGSAAAWTRGGKLGEGRSEKTATRTAAEREREHDQAPRLAGQCPRGPDGGPRGARGQYVPQVPCFRERVDTLVPR